jgi:hypothetical protein
MSRSQADVTAPTSNGEPLSVLGPAAGGLAGAVTATFAALCCAGPAVAGLLGAGGVAASMALNPYRPVLLGGSLALIAFGFWRVYARRYAGPDGRACRMQSGRSTRTLLWVSAFAWLAAALIPSLFSLETGG